jgi:hypothetical protein
LGVRGSGRSSSATLHWFGDWVSAPAMVRVLQPLLNQVTEAQHAYPLFRKRSTENPLVTGKHSAPAQCDASPGSSSMSSRAGQNISRLPARHCSGGRYRVQQCHGTHHLHVECLPRRHEGPVQRPLQVPPVQHTNVCHVGHEWRHPGDSDHGCKGQVQLIGEALPTCEWTAQEWGC